MGSKGNSTLSTNMELSFFYPSLSSQISTDILEIETYSNNLVVAPAIGNLVTYFSDDRPTPYLAKSWKKEGLVWTFEIREGLKCENGELITAPGFAKSLAKSIRLYSQMNDHPVFKHLIGYESLLKNKLVEFDGIKASGNLLIFNFKRNIRGGFLEHLTMAPFGYICEENYVGDKWKDPAKIVSSGPYSLNSIFDQNNYTLNRREDWPLEFKGELKKVVIYRSGIDEFKQAKGPKIIEVQNPSNDDLLTYKNIRQIPQNLIVVKLNDKHRAFGNIENRTHFLRAFRKHLNEFKYEANSVSKTEHFFANDKSILKPIAVPKAAPSKNIKLLAKIMLKGPNSPNDINKIVIQEAANELGWSVEFDHEPYESFRETFRDPKYDLYVQAAEIGGGFEGWVIDMLFCSDIGDQWPDPSGRICSLTKEFDGTELNESEASQRFQNYLIEDAALIPTFHRGGFYLFSDELDIKSLSPMITRVRFEEIKAKK